MAKCEFCGEQEAVNECACCYRLFCEDCGDLYYPDEEYYCNLCREDLDREDEEEAQTEKWLEEGE
mgnify:CR=1 FL=1